MFWCYELAATYALVVFYWIFFPDILFGALDVPRVDAVPLLRHYVISQSLFSAVCAAGIVVFGTRIAATHRRSAHGGARAGAMDAETGRPWPARVFVLSGAIRVGDRLRQRSEVVPHEDVGHS